MPACHRCKKVQASAEMRKTTLGHICKDRSSCADRRTAAPPSERSPGRGGSPK